MYVFLGRHGNLQKIAVNYLEVCRGHFHHRLSVLRIHCAAFLDCNLLEIVIINVEPCFKFLAAACLTDDQCRSFAADNCSSNLRFVFALSYFLCEIQSRGVLIVTARICPRILVDVYSKQSEPCR